MKRYPTSVVLAAALLTLLAGCTAGVSTGSTVYRSDGYGSTSCVSRAGAGVSVPDGPGAYSDRECVSSEQDDEAE